VSVRRYLLIGLACLGALSFVALALYLALALLILGGLSLAGLIRPPRTRTRRYR
jgi:hypothetical protein